MKKLIKNVTYGLIIFLLLAFNSCSKHWTEAIQHGSISNKNFSSEINIEIQNKILIVPVQIKNKTYRFLFDTGAPFSISEELQEQFNYKIVSKGNIRDSDNNQSKIDYVSVKNILIGDIAFKNQTAFVGDFKKNPIIACLNIDGIIGSNLMRHCNWKIDYQVKQITISNQPFQFSKKSTSVPFKVSNQYNLLFSIKMDAAKINNIKVDYGSNGSLTLPNNVFKTLKDKNIINTVYKEKGTASTGILGESEILKREITFKDSIKLNELVLDKTAIKSGNSGLIGTKILSQYKVAINWSNKSMNFEKYETNKIPNFETFGFRLGKYNDNSFYIRSVIENSSAYYAGLKPNMQVYKIDDLDLLTNNFCDYMKFMDTQLKKTMSLKFKNELDEIITIQLNKSTLKKK